MPEKPKVEQWRKKPVVIEAIQHDGTHDRTQQIIEWMNASNPRFDPNDSATWTVSGYYGTLTIKTSEGEMTASKGDWIIRGVKGEFYPCKPDIFAATYEPAHAPTPAPEPTAERDLYALLRGICEDVIDWLGALSYDHGTMTAKNVLDHPLTQEIRTKLHKMYQHPLDDKLLIRTDQLEAAPAAAQGAPDPLYRHYEEYTSMVPPKGQRHMTYREWQQRLSDRLTREKNTPAMALPSSPVSRSSVSTPGGAEGSKE